MFMQGFNDDDRITMRMDKEKICYECAYWKNLIDYPLPHMEIVGNKCMRVLPEVPKRDKSMLLGGKGKLRYFVRTDFSLVRSNDVWSIGVVPERFRKQLPKTMSEVTKNVYLKIQKNGHKCSARGCFDRYNCFRYNLELEKDHTGAFNKVPPTWKVGNEKCKDFINLTEILSDDGSV